MASVYFPTDIVPTKAEAEFIDFSATLSPPSGGPEQRLLRAGRWQVTYQYPPLTPDQARRAVARLVQGKQYGIIVPFYRPGITQAGGGAVAVNGGGQTGSLLTIDGIVGASDLFEGWFASVVTGGRRFLYMINAYSSVAGGAAMMPVFPMLRRSPADNDVVELADPKIEGFVTSQARWSIESAVEYGLSFTVREAA